MSPLSSKSERVGEHFSFFCSIKHGMTLNRHFPRGILIIMISNPLLQTQNQRLWMWHTSYRSAAPTFHKYIEAVICRSVR